MYVRRPPFKLRVKQGVAVQNPPKRSVRAKKPLKDNFVGHLVYIIYMVLVQAGGLSLFVIIGILALLLFLCLIFYLARVCTRRKNEVKIICINKNCMLTLPSKQSPSLSVDTPDFHSALYWYGGSPPTFIVYYMVEWMDGQTE